MNQRFENSFWYIKNCSLFSQLLASDIVELDSQSRVRKLNKGGSVYVARQYGDALLLVAEGRVKICHASADGKQTSLGFVDAGEVFGESTIFGDATHGEYVEATETTTLVLIQKEAFERVLARHPNLALGISRLIGKRCQQIERRLRNFLFHSNRERVTYLLLELCERYGMWTDEGVLLEINLSHQDMSSMIGCTRETVNVILGQMQRETLLEIARKRIVITDLPRLAAEVKEPAPEINTPAGS